MNLSMMVKLPDIFFSRAYLNIKPEKHSVIVLLLHGLFRDESEIKKQVIDPQLAITIEQFTSCIQYFKQLKYTFISPDDILSGLDESRNYVMITFDDGYYNNIHAGPVLKKYDVPGSFFVSTSHIQKGEGYWWDAMYRYSRQKGISFNKLLQQQESLKTMKQDEIHNELKHRFGDGVLDTVGDIDRPFTKEELQEFSKNDCVYIGNHTRDHAILTNYTKEEILGQLVESQRFIKEITGKVSCMISYPNGNYSIPIVQIAKNVGFNMGFTVEQKKNYMPLSSEKYQLFTLGRFEVTGDVGIQTQCDLMRSDYVFFRRIQNRLQSKFDH